jgi:hypothetical protein
MIKADAALREKAAALTEIARLKALLPSAAD